MHGWEGGLVQERSWPPGTGRAAGVAGAPGGRAWENFADLPSRESVYPGKCWEWERSDPASTPFRRAPPPELKEVDEVGLERRKAPILIGQ